MASVPDINELTRQIADMLRRISSLENTTRRNYGNITIDGNAGQFIVRDSTGIARVLIDGDTGVMKISQSGIDVRTATNSELTFYSLYRQLREANIHTGGGNTFTNVAPHVAIDDWVRKIDFDDWDDMEWYFEASFKAGTGTASVQLYNLTDSAVVGSSTITTTSTSYVGVRSSQLTKPSGVKSFVVRYGHTPSGGGGDFINLTIATHIFRRPA